MWSVSLKFRGPITAKLGPTLRIRQQSGCAKTGRWDLGGRWWGSDAARRRQARNLDVFIAWFVFWRSLQVTVRPMLRDRYPVCLLYINVAVLWPNGRSSQQLLSSCFIAYQHIARLYEFGGIIIETILVVHSSGESHHTGAHRLEF